jgi:DNA polymerase
MAARAEAGAATTLDNLRARLAAFDGCPLKVTARQLVFADGNPHAPMMLVGEAPGRDEDASGLPFVGRAGQLLDRMLAAIGLDRTGVYIANVIPWRPPGNRTPSDFETEVLKPFIRRQIELAAPEILVMLGGQSLKVLTGSTQGIIRSRGQWMSYRAGERDIPALPTLHPAFLLRQPIKKRDAWADFLKLKAKLAAVAGTLH